MSQQSKCEVCTSSMAASSRRYGGACCNGCASFFSRSIPIESQFMCNDGSNQCLKVPSKNGKGCKKCRFAKCLEIGMSTPEIYGKKIAEEKKALEELTLFAQIADGFLTVALKFPSLFESYLTEDNKQFLSVSLDPFQNHEVITEPMHPLTFLLSKHPFTQDEFPTFCHFCLCTLEFNSLPESKQAEMKKAQEACLERVCSRVSHKDRLPDLRELSKHFLNVFYALNYI